MRFRIAHLMWLVAASAVYSGLFRWFSTFDRGPDGEVDWFLRITHPAIWMMVVVFYGSIIFGNLHDSLKRHDRSQAEDYIKHYTSGRNVEYRP